MLTQEKFATLKEGFALHRVGVEDLDRVLALINEYSQATLGINEQTRNELKNFWQTPGLDMAEDLRRVTNPDGNLVGYVEALTETQPPAHPFIWMRLHPIEDVGNAGSALLAWALQRVTQVMETVPSGLRVSVQTFLFTEDKLAHELFEDFGFKLIRHSFIMHREIREAPPDPVWPAGITLRPFDADLHAEAVYRADDEAFSDHFGHVEQPFETGFAKFKHFMSEDEFDPSLWFVAMDGNDIAGISLCRKNEQEETPMGWVGSLGVRRPWRKRGLGMALLLHSFGEVYRRGYKKVGLGVDASNLTGALKLYERVGMYIARQYDRYEKELRPGKELMTIEVKE